MWGVVQASNLRNSAVGALLLAGVPMAAADTPMTAGVIMEKMPANERGAYLVGLVEGFAYSRFKKDSAAVGSKTETGMKCIFDVLYADKRAGIARIEAAFRTYPDHLPSVVLGAILKKECGE